MKLIGIFDILRISIPRNSRCCSTIVVPKRVKRDSLSILKALASIPQTDYHAPHYKFIDDPYLIPYNGVDKKVFSLSFANGKEAARYVLEKHPNLFHHNTAHPVIEDFMPSTGPAYPENTVEGLKERIALKMPLEAFGSYKQIVEAGQQVTRALFDDLFDLLCFSNYRPLSNHVGFEKGYYANDIFEEEGRGDATHWKDNGPAESLFNEIEKPNIRNICSLIRGMVKFSAHEKAFGEYEKYIKGNVKLDVQTYNAILSCVPHMKDNPEDRWNLTLEILQTMNTNNVKPNVKTFNEVLATLSTCLSFRETARNYLMAVLNEMGQCNIEPNLTTWWRTVQIAYGFHGSRSNILDYIIQKLSVTGFSLQEPTDFEFFSCSMEKCSRVLRNPDIAKSLNKLVVENHLEHLGDNGKAASYYTNYLMLLSHHETLDDFMDEYNRVTPHVFSPTYKVFDCLLKSIEYNYGYRYLPKVWSDMVQIHFVKRIDLLEKLFQLMAKADVDLKLQEIFVSIADRVVEMYATEKSYPTRKPLELTGNILGNMIHIYLKSSKLNNCWQVINILKESASSIYTLPGEASLKELSEAYIKEQDFNKAYDVIAIVAKHGYICIEELVEKALSEMNLDDSQKNQLKSLLK